MALHDNEDGTDLVKNAAAIAVAFVSNNRISSADMPSLIGEIHRSLTGLRAPGVPARADLVPAVPIKKSITADYLICLDDGLMFKSLKRHLTSLGMTPDEYRKKWGLPADYPMVAAGYSATRTRIAKAIGLGRKQVAPPRKRANRKPQAAGE